MENVPLNAEIRRALEKTSCMMLTTRGRKTRKPRTVELSFALRGDEILCLAGSGGKVNWYQNLLKHRDVSIEIKGHHLDGKAEPVSGDRKRAVAEILDLFRKKYGVDYVRSWYSGTERAPVRIQLQETES